ncbi:MAG: 4Fe-4S dicluster domain-containing protein [Verrucomicrobiales bacterium]|nr:4Fe-4S dicluster domain-containing protein [Verrucomicrobiales bacterium]
MTLVEQVQAAGVVGAGGAGFPTHIKLQGRCEAVIANGAECEPLLHKDSCLLEHQAPQIVDGLKRTMEAVRASRGWIALKRKHAAIVEAVRAAVRGTDIGVHLLGDYYPAGDEFVLVHEVTGRLIPAGGIPLQVGCVVQNVETLVNISNAASGLPVTKKVLTIAGAVRDPTTLVVPLGTSIRDCVIAAGNPTVADPVLLVGGVMMGELSTCLDSPVTKTTAGVVILSADHPIAKRRGLTAASMRAIGRSACDQCRYCTEYCPRYLLGYGVEPHQVMRGLGFSMVGEPSWSTWAGLCCACGLCTLYACPEGLFPKEACDDARAELKRNGWKPDGDVPIAPHPMHSGRRVPAQGLLRRLHLQEFDHPAPLKHDRVQPARVVLRRKQGAGVAAVPIVGTGAEVSSGALVAEPPPGQLGARLHAPIAGTIASIDAESIVIQHHL